MQITPQFPRIDLGDTGWKMPSAPEYLFGSKQRALAYAEANRLDPAGLTEKDTRPTMEAVRQQIADREGEACGIEPERRKWSVGPWDEYFSLGYNEACRTDGKEKFPTGYRWVCAYVVTGGSEGLYLHVDTLAADDRGRETRRNLFLGKTRSDNREAWEACFASAARIAWLLHA